MAVAPGRRHEPLDLGLGQVLFAGPQLAVGEPPGGKCSYYGGQRDQLEVSFSHVIRPMPRVDCSNKNNFSHRKAAPIFGREGNRGTLRSSEREFTPMLYLYHGTTSVCAIKVRLTLEAKALPGEGEVLWLQRGDQYRPEYLKLNPNALVPTLVHDGKVIIESTVIMEY